MKIYGAIEVGSTTTKGAILKGEELEFIPFAAIELKNNANKNGGKITDADKNTLFAYVKNIQKRCERLFVCGTAFFRTLAQDAQDAFLKEFKQETGETFHIVTSDLENELTVYGVTEKLNYNGKIAVMIGGGGSIELAIVQNKQTLETLNYKIGAIDLVQVFADLCADKVTTPYETLVNFVLPHIKAPQNKADVLVLAGGDYIKFYQMVGFAMDRNTLYQDENQPYMFSAKKSAAFDQEYLYDISLDALRKKHPADAAWLNGTRGMRMCVHVIMDILGVKYIVPTRINMLNGILMRMQNEK